MKETAREDSYNDVRRLLVARSEDGELDETLQAIGAEVVRKLGQEYPTFPLGLPTNETRRDGDTR